MRVNLLLGICRLESLRFSLPRMDTTPWSKPAVLAVIGSGVQDAVTPFIPHKDVVMMLLGYRGVVFDSCLHSLPIRFWKCLLAAVRLYSWRKSTGYCSFRLVRTWNMYDAFPGPMKAIDVSNYDKLWAGTA